MGITVQDTPLPTPALLTLLESYVPRSLPLLRRLQFTRRPGGTTANTHILLAHQEGSAAPGPFAAAYVDIAKGPETEVWLFCSLEGNGERGEWQNDHQIGSGLEMERRLKTTTEKEREREPLVLGTEEWEREQALEATMVLLRHVKSLESKWDKERQKRRNEGSIMVGSLDEGLRGLLLGRGVKTTYSSPHNKWLFRVDNLPSLPSPLTDDMYWDVVKREDVELIISRTHIPRSEATLMLLPSTAVRLRDGTPIAWAFMHMDGTLSTLHCEEPYRGRGIAKATAIKVMVDHNKEFGDDGWCLADVHIDNVQSQGVCKSIGGKMAWRMSWSLVSLDSIGDED